MSRSKFSPARFTEICQKTEIALEKGLPVAFTADRVSSADQQDNTSLKHQNERGKAYAADHGFEVVYNESFVESASKAERPYFHAYMEYARRLKSVYPSASLHLIFKSTDRFARNVRDLAVAEELFQKEEISIHLYDEGLVLKQGGSSSETLRFLLNGVIAKSETDRLSERVRAALNYKRQLGMKPGPTCWGYRYVKRPTMMHIIDKAVEADLRFMFDAFDANDWTLKEAVDFFNQKNIRSSSGRPWTVSNLRNFLRNPNYHGEHITKNGEVIALDPDRHERYYDKSRWEERLKRMENRRTHRSERKLKDAFAEILSCAECGKSYIFYERPKPSGKVYYYYRHDCKKTRNNRQFPRKQLFDLIDGKVASMRHAEDYYDRLRELFQPRIKKVENDHFTEASWVKLQIGQLKRRRTELYGTMYDHYSPEEIESESALVQSKLVRLFDMLKSVDIEESRVITEIIQDIARIRSLPDAYLSAPPAQKGFVLGGLLSSVRVTENSVEVEWKEPYSFLMRDEVLALAAVLPASVAAAGTEAGKTTARKMAHTIEEGRDSEERGIARSGDVYEPLASREASAAEFDRSTAFPNGENAAPNKKPAPEALETGDQSGFDQLRSSTEGRT